LTACFISGNAKSAWLAELMDEFTVVSGDITFGTGPKTKLSKFTFAICGIIEVFVCGAVWLYVPR
jgi:hypothetical protein